MSTYLQVNIYDMQYLSLDGTSIVMDQQLIQPAADLNMWKTLHFLYPHTIPRV